jgi:hypothetical protein
MTDLELQLRAIMIAMIGEYPDGIRRIERAFLDVLDGIDGTEQEEISDEPETQH